VDGSTTSTASPSTQDLWSTRIARPVHDLHASTQFYRDVLGLRVLASFAGHSGYDGVFLALPGGAELELTHGPSGPVRSSEEDLLVLYARDDAHFRSVVQRLATAGTEPVEAANPYWNVWGATFLDPDGFRIVIARSLPARPAGDPQ
jgi:catechol 2,3-dioxygenase-like lactoylglutathione lyase family enzyme